MSSWDRWASVPSMAFVHGSWRGVYIKIARDKGRKRERERQKWGVLARMRTAHVGKRGACLQEKSLRLPWLPERSVCNELRLILWSVGLDDQSARGNRRARICLWAVYGAGVLATLRCKYCDCSQSDGAQILNCFNFCAWGFYRSVRRPMLCNV
jgi:hypothetical protein